MSEGCCSSERVEASFARTLSTRSSSTQPPDTEPTIWPSSRIATIAPTGRGAEPQVLTIVPSAARWPLLRHACAVRSTSISTLSIALASGKCYRNSTALPAGLATSVVAAVADEHSRAVAGRDLAHDGQPQAAAGARRPGHAVETLEHPLALGGRNAGTVVFHFHERLPAAAAGAHGH